jgi:trk system potassium uptake protein TrkH
MVLAVLPSLGVGGVFLLKGEAGLTPERFTPRLVHTAQILFGIYVGLSLLEVILLYLCGMSLFDAVTHTFGTIATGGFSPRNASVAAYHSLPIELVIIVFMILGATNFGLYYRVLTGDGRIAWHNTEWRVFIGVLSVAILLIAGNLLKESAKFSGEGLDQDVGHALKGRKWALLGVLQPATRLQNLLILLNPPEI